MKNKTKNYIFAIAFICVGILGIVMSIIVLILGSIERMNIVIAFMFFVLSGITFIDGIDIFKLNKATLNRNKKLFKSFFIK